MLAVLTFMGLRGLRVEVAGDDWILKKREWTFSDGMIFLQVDLGSLERDFILQGLLRLVCLVS